MQKIKLLSVIIPAFNESDTIHLILDKIKDTELINNIEKEILIVNDCSKDITAAFETVLFYVFQY